MALILIAAAAFRLYNVNWDAGQHLHPDERFVIMVDNGIQWPSSIWQYFDSARSPLNPYNRGFSNFVYGTLPIFLLKLVATLLHRDTYDGALSTGRVLSALSDVGSVWLLFLAGRRLYNQRVALLASAFLALSVLGIQLSHFMAVDTFTVFFLMLTFYYAVQLMKDGGWLPALGAGFAFGLALACKLSIALAPIFIAGAILTRLIELWPRERLGEGVPAPMAGGSQEAALFVPTRIAPLEEPRTAPAQAVRAEGAGSLWYAAALFVAAMTAAAVAFRIFQPYAFQGFASLSAKWLQDEIQQKNFVAGTVDVPFLLQWAHTTPILFPVKDIVLWGMGWPLGLLGFASLAVAGVRLVWHRQLVHLLPVAWIVSNLLYLGLQQAKTMRYFYQLYPFLALLAAWLVIWLYDRRSRKINRGLALGAFVLAGSLLNAYAFSRIYSRPNTRVAASAWIYAHIPTGKTIASEHWDDALPLSLPGPGTQPNRYKQQQLTLYDDDNQAKIDMIVKVLSSSDYVIMSSNRLYGSIPRIPQRYPITTEYYKLLFAGQLGFDLVHQQTSYPSLFGIQIKDDREMGFQGLWAQLQPDEAFTVYDHPPVLIYQKAAGFSPENVRELLSAVPDQGALRLNPKQASLPVTSLMLPPADLAADQAGGTWSRLFQRDSPVNHAPALAWWLAIELLGLVTFPLLFLALRRLWDGGWLLSKPAGLLLLAYLAWLAPSLHLARFTRGEIALAGLAVAAAGLLALALQRTTILGFVRTRWRRLLAGEALFVVLVAFFFVIRASNPDLWHPAMGGEKPMDFAFLNATLKTSYFPPYDPWFSGGYINYYYFGYVIVGALIKLLGIVPAVGYNLAVAILPAFSAIGAFTVVASLVAWRRYPHLPSRLRGRGTVFAFGLVAAMFVAIMGNLGDVVLIFQGLATMGGSHGVVGGVGQLLAGKPLPFRIEWWYWNATREIPDVFNEMPFFTFLYGDLHAHAIALPYTLLAIGGATGLVLSAAVKGPVDAGFLPAWRRWVAPGEIAGVVLLALVIGALKPTNTWDFPTYLILAGGFILVADMVRHRRFEWEGLSRAAIKIGLLLMLATVLFEPYSQHFATLYSSISLWTGKRTELGPYLIVHGIFLFVIACYLLHEVFGARGSAPAGRLARLFVRHRGRLFTVVRRAAFAPATPGRRLGLAYLSDGLAMFVLLLAVVALLKLWLPLLLLALLGLATLALFAPDAPAHKRVIYILIGLGLGLSLGTEFFVLQGDVGRMNTVAKTDLQVWVLWGLACAVALYDLAVELRPSPGATGPARVSAPWLVRRFVFGGTAILVACGLFYTLAGGIARAHDRFTQLPLTDNGEAYMPVSTWQDQQPLPLKPDFEAITWLQDNVQGSPVILEGRGRLYSWANRVSIYTGLPTVLGWDWHETQQRGLFGDQEIQRRAGDVTNMYTNPSLPAIMPMLQQYHVRYVYVGPFEREIYPANGLAKFANLPAVYNHDGVQIYELLGN